MLGTEFNRFKKTVDDHILDYLPKIESNSITLYEAMKYSLLAGGKRLRPVLMLSTYEMCLDLENKGEKPDVSYALPFACAIEYIQTYSLIHDDLPAMDNDDFRRGKPTNHKVFGEDIAILAGDGLLSAAYEAIMLDMLLYLDNDSLLKRKVRAAQVISKGTGCRGMIAGQIADVENEEKACSYEMLQFIHQNKTAAFICASVISGAYLAGANRRLIESLTTYGECLGLAFQVVDDLLDVIGDAEEMGKQTGVDAELGKATYPAMFGVEGSKEKAYELINKARKSIEEFGDSAGVLENILDFLEDEIR